MQLPSYYFNDFLTKIRPQECHINNYKTGHHTLREQLRADETLSPHIVSTFLQGSYRRATAIRPQGEKRSDVDIIVVTKFSEDEFTPQKALDFFVPFLDKYYKGKYKPQGRSFGIELSDVELDLVITSAPSESEIGIFRSDSIISDNTLEMAEADNDWNLISLSLLTQEETVSSFSEPYRLDTAKKEFEWKIKPLRIPDIDTDEWQDTHPLEQIRWTWDKNRRCNKHYINVVKCLKWWRRINHPTPKYPKGYPVEHLIGQCCPDGIESVADGVTRTLEAIAEQYKTHAALKITPNLQDHGVPSHNVFKRVSGKDFADFYNQVCEAAEIARLAFDEEDKYKSVEHWQLLFGNDFPDPPPKNNGGGSNGSGGNNPTGGFTSRQNPTHIQGGRFA